MRPCHKELISSDALAKLPYIFLQSGLLSSISRCVTRTCQQLRKCYGNRFCESNQRDEQEETRTHFQSSASLSGSLSLVDCCSVGFVSVPLTWNKSQDLMWRNQLSRYCKCRHKRFCRAVKIPGQNYLVKPFYSLKMSIIQSFPVSIITTCGPTVIISVERLSVRVNFSKCWLQLQTDENENKTKLRISVW